MGLFFNIKPLSILLVLFYVSSCDSQNSNQASDSFVSIDSLLFIDSSSIPEYPYQERYESYFAKEKHISDSLNSLMDSDSLVIVDYFPPKPKLVLVENNTDTISIKDYCKKYSNGSCTKSLILFKIKMEWNGKISEIRLNKIKGEIPKNLDLVEMAKKLRGIPPKADGIPIPGPNNFIFLINCSVK